MISVEDVGTSVVGTHSTTVRLNESVNNRIEEIVERGYIRSKAMVILEALRDMEMDLLRDAQKLHEAAGDNPPPNIDNLVRSALSSKYYGNQDYQVLRGKCKSVNLIANINFLFGTLECYSFYLGIDTFQEAVNVSIIPKLKQLEEFDQRFQCECERQNKESSKNSGQKHLVEELMKKANIMPE